VAEGTPEDVGKVKESYTGRYLKDLLGRRAGGAQENRSNAGRRGGGPQEKVKKQAAE
jgi:excinuclease ABC subunit A